MGEATGIIKDLEASSGIKSNYTAINFDEDNQSDNESLNSSEVNNEELFDADSQKELIEQADSV